MPFCKPSPQTPEDFCRHPHPPLSLYRPLQVLSLALQTSILFEPPPFAQFPRKVHHVIHHSIENFSEIIFDRSFAHLGPFLRPLLALRSSSLGNEHFHRILSISSHDSLLEYEFVSMENNFLMKMNVFVASVQPASFHTPLVTLIGLIPRYDASPLTSSMTYASVS